MTGRSIAAALLLCVFGLAVAACSGASEQASSDPEPVVLADPQRGENNVAENIGQRTVTIVRTSTVVETVTKTKMATKSVTQTVSKTATTTVKPERQTVVRTAEPVTVTVTAPPVTVTEQVEVQQAGLEAPDQPADVYFENCDAARAAGAAPVYAGDAGYRSGLDRDGDGVGCEN